MNEFPILGQVALGYSPMIDAKRNVVATRLTVFPARPDDAAIDAAALLAAVAQVWPADGGRVSLNVVSETLLTDLMNAEVARNLMVEVPAFMAVDEAHGAAIAALHQRGNTLLLKGRPLKPLPRELLPCFKHSIIDVAEEQRPDAPPPGVTRSITSVQSGVRTLAELDAAFKRGAVAVLGWPIDDQIVAATASGKAPQGDLQTIVELIRRVDHEEPLDRLEAVLKLDPSLAFKLLRYINSPGFGLAVEITSFRHAIMMLGYRKLKRWLALLLASASKDSDMKPVMFAAVRRGLLMEELARRGGDEEMRNDMFICGVFSLLDRMMRQPFSQLLGSLPVSSGVQQALIDGSGPYKPFFDVVCAVEQESLFDIRETADALMMSVAEVNAAVLRALAGASRLD